MLFGFGTGILEMWFLTKPIFFLFCAADMLQRTSFFSPGVLGGWGHPTLKRPRGNPYQPKPSSH